MALVAARQQHKDAVEVCQTRFSENASDAVARAKCINAADEILRPFDPYADLYNLRNAKRNELAERLAAGKITRAQMVLEFTQLNSQIATEWQHRSNSDRSGAAQQQAATAATIGAINANAPRSCTLIGNTTNCY
jgi:hypothetical protein